ncbi:MAG: hypothetical protein ACXWLW_10160 [Rhizomicrobium sp.]
MKARTFLPLGAIPTGLVLIAGFFVTLAVDLPGHLSYDSILQLLQGRTGVYNTWHPPVMAWLLGIADDLVPGAALFVLFEAALCFGTFLSLLVFARHKPHWPSVGVALACILSPQLLLYQGLVWKDVLFADAAVAGFVCLAHVARVWPRREMRMALIAVAFSLLCLAALTRQNGLLLLPLGAMALGWVAARHSGVLRTGFVYCGFVLVAAAVLLIGATIALNTRSNGDSGPREQLTLLQVYDLSGAVAADHHFSLVHLAEDQPGLERLIRHDEAPLYTPVRSDPIASSLPLQAELRIAKHDAIGADWRALIVEHPRDYMKIRARVFWWVFATPDIIACRPIFVGVDGPAGALKALGMAPRRTATDNALQSYGMSLLNTPAFSHLAFAAIAALSLVALLRRRRAEDIAIATMLLAAFAFTASFFVISIACDYRYLYFLDLSALVSLFYLSLDVRSVLKGSP